MSIELTPDERVEFDKIISMLTKYRGEFRTFQSYPNTIIRSTKHRYKSNPDCWYATECCPMSHLCMAEYNIAIRNDQIEDMADKLGISYRVAHYIANVADGFVMGEPRTLMEKAVGLK